MRHLKARAAREAVKGSITVWRPWQLKQPELIQGVAVSTPSHQCLTQEYLIVYGQSGAIDFQYRNTHLSGQAVDGTISVIEPGEIWTSQTKDVTYHLLSPLRVCQTLISAHHTFRQGQRLRTYSPVLAPTQEMPSSLRLIDQ